MLSWRQSFIGRLKLNDKKETKLVKDIMLPPLSMKTTECSNHKEQDEFRTLDMKNLTYSFISLSLKHNFLAMLHPFLHMHIHNLLFLSNLVPFARWALISLTDDLTCDIDRCLLRTKTKHKVKVRQTKHALQLNTWALAFRADMLHLLNHSQSNRPCCNLHSSTLASITSPWCSALWAFPEN